MCIASIFDGLRGFIDIVVSVDRCGLYKCGGKSQSFKVYVSHFKVLFLPEGLRTFHFFVVVSFF